LATSNADSTALFSVLGPGTWNLQSNGPNGKAGSKPLLIDLEEGAHQVVNMELQYWQNLKVQVFHQGSPAAGVSGHLTLPSPWRLQLAGLELSDVEGRLVFPAIPDVSVAAEFRLNPWSLPVTQRWGKSRDEELRVILPAGTVKGAWVANRVGIEGVGVLVDQGRGSPVELGQSGPDGAFVVHCVGPGRYRIRPRHPHWVSAHEQPWFNHPGGKLVLEPIELIRAGIMSGLVISPRLNQPFSPIQAQLIGSEPSGFRRRAPSPFRKFLGGIIGWFFNRGIKF
jgi:hypothetical protein